MISTDLFDEFIGNYYKRLVPFLKAKGVKHVFVDTDVPDEPKSLEILSS